MTTPADVERLAEMARKIDANPLRIVGRAVGLGIDEQHAGVPGWAWGVLLIGAGVAVGVHYGDEIKDRLGID